MSFQLSALETRILGCLLEKERTTPENYPLSLHSLTTACNQTTNRDPITGYAEREVEEGLDSLRQKKVATVIWAAGSRVQKYRHNLLDHYTLEPGEIALLCVLLLRGPQTPGELRSRAERLHPFGHVQAVETTLHALAGGDEPLVRMLAPRPGQKEKRYVQLLAGEPEIIENTAEAAPAPAMTAAPSGMDLLRAEVATLKSEVATLRAEFAEFRRQLE